LLIIWELILQRSSPSFSPYLYANTSNKFNVIVWDIGTYIRIDNSLFCDVSYRHTNNTLGLIGLGLGVRFKINPIKKYSTPLISYKKQFALVKNNYSSLHELMIAFELSKFNIIKPVIRYGYWYVTSGSHGLFMPTFSFGLILNLKTK
jgi:hypothetical protein